MIELRSRAGDKAWNDGFTLNDRCAVFGSKGQLCDLGIIELPITAYVKVLHASLST